MCLWKTSNGSQICANKLDHVVLHIREEGENRRYLDPPKLGLMMGVVHFLNDMTK